jgi:uncharacterized protein (DUF2147 family)
MTTTKETSMKNLWCRTALFTAMIALCAALLPAQGNPAVGLWRNEEPEKVVMVRTYEQNGKLFGKIESAIKKGAKEDPDAKCTKCSGENKDKPIKGLVMIYDMEKDGNRWSSGKIIDPDDGKIYKCRITPVEGGKKLEVRGSVAIFSKTQTWTRTE